MRNENALNKIKEALERAECLPSESVPDKVIKTSVVEILKFCEEATVAMDKAHEGGVPVRTGLLLSALNEIKRDSALIDMALALDEDQYALLREDLSESIRLFTEYAGYFVEKLPMFQLGVVDMSIEN